MSILNQKLFKVTAIGIGSLILLAATMLSAGIARPIVVHVIAEPTIVGESQLQSSLEVECSRDGKYLVLSQTDHPQKVPFPDQKFDTDSIARWGESIGGRYLMLVDVNREAIERKKTFSIPLIVHKYQAVGIVQGELRLIDLDRDRILLAEPFEIETRGPRSIQAYVDDNRDDADIMIPATEKTSFFRKMEDETAKYLRKRLAFATNGR